MLSVLLWRSDCVLMIGVFLLFLGVLLVLVFLLV